MADSQHAVTSTDVDEQGTAASAFLSERVEEAIAEARREGLDGGLHEHVDPEGLNRLHRHFRELGGTFWSMEFEVDGLEVVVRADGTVSVR